MTATQRTSSSPIGVFDSGIGGLSVVRALLRRLPHENILYFGDTARVPYGPKSPQVIREYAAEDTQVLVRDNVKLVVVACNTVSSVALDVVQKHAKVPVVGMIAPGSRAAVAASKKKRIGVIGTAGTIASNSYTNAIKQIDSSVKVFGQACPLFVPLVEEGWMDHEATALIAKEYLFPLKLEKIDTLVLGCTHYPLLRERISTTLNNGTALIDSGEAAAEEVEALLDQYGLRNPSMLKGNIQCYVSDLAPKFAAIGERFLGHKLGKVRIASASELPVK